MAVVLCPIGATLSLEINWPAAGRSLSGATGISQVRETASADADLLITGSVSIATSGGDYDNGIITITLSAANTLTMDEGSRGFLDLRLAWADEVQYPITDQWVELEFSPTISRA